MEHADVIEIDWVPGYEGLYLISSTRMVYGCKKDSMLKLQEEGRRIGLWKDRKQSYFHVGKLIDKLFTRDMQHVLSDMADNGKEITLDWAPGHQGKYLVSTDGRVYSCQTNELVGSDGSNGYRRVNLRDDDGNVTRWSIHRLVATVFIPNPDNKPMVDHADHDRSNNNVSNLSWVSANENMWNMRAHSRGSSKYKGVTWDKYANKWKAQIRENKKDHHLGHFVVEEDAAKAYDVAAKKYHGKKAFANFPGQVLE